MVNTNILINIESFIRYDKDVFQTKDKYFGQSFVVLLFPLIGIIIAFGDSTGLAGFGIINVVLAIVYIVVESIIHAGRKDFGIQYMLLKSIPELVWGISGLILAIMFCFELYPYISYCLGVLGLCILINATLYLYKFYSIQKGKFIGKHNSYHTKLAVMSNLAIVSVFSLSLIPQLFVGKPQTQVELIMICLMVCTSTFCARGALGMLKIYYAKKYDIKIVPTWEIEEGKEPYEWIGYPIKIKLFAKLSPEQAEQFFNWHMEKKEWRMNHLQEFANETSNTAINLDYSSDSLVLLWEWFEKRIFMKDARLEFNTRIIAMDVAIYLAETLIRSQSDVEWSYITEVDDKRLVNRPILTGFPNGVMFEPYQAVTELALVSRKDKCRTRLFELYNDWAK